MSVSWNNSSGMSNSSSYIPDYQEEPFLNQLAQLSAGLGQQQYDWSQGEYAKNSALTDDAVQNYLTASQKAMDLAGNNFDRYTQLFQPQENNLIQDANTYASPDRVKAEMGQAMSGVAQSSDANRQNAERELQSFGVDPSSGRYAELEQASATQRGAAQAAAGTSARLATEATGRQLRGQAIQVGQQYPGQEVNALNSAYQGLAGAVNSRLANTNTGVNAFNGAKGYLDTASQLKYPPLGNKSSSQQSSSGGGNGSGGSGGSKGSGGGSGSGNGGGLPFGNTPGTGTLGPSSVTPAYGRGVGGPDILPVDGGQGDNSSYDPTMGWGSDSNDLGSGTTANDGYGINGGDPWQSAGQDNFGWGSGAYDNAPDPFGGGGNSYDGGQAFGPAPDNSGGGGYSDTGGYDNSGSYDGGYGGGDVSGGYSDTGGYDFASGGAIPDAPTTGGYADPSLSPSGGQQTDDIPAHLNANEFVIPRDVAMWKGQEFFQKLIDQSRKARQGASAQGQPSNKPVGQPAFVSSGA